MKVTLNCNSGANIHSTRSETFDLDNADDCNQFGCTKEEWMNFSEDDKQEFCNEWAEQRLEIYYEEEV